MTGPRLILGVDPGLGGALALVDLDGPRLVAALPMPVVRFGRHAIVDAAAILDWLEPFRVSAIVIEDVHAMPGQGVASSFQFGRLAGGVESALTAVGCPIAHVTPATWKKRAGLGREKGRSLDLARLRFGPREEFRRAKDHGVAEAALIALYGRPA